MLYECDQVKTLAATIYTRDGHGYEISVYPWIPNPTGADTGLSLCPLVRARVQLETQWVSSNGFEKLIPESANPQTMTLVMYYV